ncbi:MAG: hypothetical protein FWD34_02565 [Oscillospiraceae bacterium]|nr:hypothetical protein [Oscillospiraceae bacterium]
MRFIPIVFAVVFLTACTDISDRRSVVTTTETTVTTATFIEELGEVYRTYSFTAEDEAFLNQAVFAGDKYVSGLADLGLVQNVIVDNEFNKITPLINSGSENIVLMFGSSTELNDYIAYIKSIRAFVPEANIIVVSAVPVLGDNSEIDEYNSALEQAIVDLRDGCVYFVDVGGELKNTFGELKSLYVSEVHAITEKGYHAVLWQLCSFTRFRVF